MKTLDEALDTIADAHKGEFDKFTDITRDIMMSERVAIFIGSALREQSEKPGDVVENLIIACVMCYVTGVKIGMEMEKP